MLEKQIIINASLSETRIALLENERVSEFFVERKRDKGLLGNIYKGVVTRVLPGMNSAFVDIGLKKSAFLFGKDVFDIKGESFALTDDEAPTSKKDLPIESYLHDGQQ